MSITPVFLGKVENNTLILNTPDRFRDYLYTLKGKSVRIIVSLIKKNRSIKQNSYYWGVVIPLLCETTGYTDEEMHDALKLKFLLDKERKIPTLKSTTSLSTIEFNKFLEDLKVWAAIDLNCIIPDPKQVEI